LIKKWVQFGREQTKDLVFIEKMYTVSESTSSRAGCMVHNVSEWIAFLHGLLSMAMLKVLTAK
jgi:hypothetical protein